MEDKFILLSGNQTHERDRAALQTTTHQVDLHQIHLVQILEMQGMEEQGHNKTYFVNPYKIDITKLL